MRGARSASKALRPALCLALCLAGCNAILDIHEPADQLLDGGVRPVDAGDPEPEPEPTDDAGVPVPLATTFAAWPMPNPKSTGLVNAQSYAVDNEGFVTDEVTQLVWQQPIDTELRDFRDAQRYCEGLTIDGGGFRLPTRIELLSLIDFTSTDPSIDSRGFADTSSAYFWSSSAFYKHRGLSWIVNFGPGPGFVSSSDMSSLYAVRCVHEAADAPARKFTVEDETVLDTGTKLSWQRSSPDAAYVWDEAADYCKSLDLAGSGWRLPTIKELMTLVDETRSMPAIDARAFPKTTDEPIWSSSRVADSDTDAWTVGFRFGFDAALAVKSEQHVRCVRSGS